MITSLAALAMPQSPPMRPTSSTSSSSSSLSSLASASSMFPLPSAVNVQLTSGLGLGSLIMHHDSYRLGHQPHPHQLHTNIQHHHHHHHQPHQASSQLLQQQQQQQPHHHHQQHQQLQHLGNSVTHNFPSHHLTPTPSPVKEANGGDPRLVSPTPSSSSEMDSPKIPATIVHNVAAAAANSSSATPVPAHLIGAYPLEIMDRMQLSAAALHHQQQQHQHKQLSGGAMHADDYSDARSSSVSSFQADSVHRADMELDMEMDDDRYSSCSEDSDLSVGKEDETNGNARMAAQTAQMAHLVKSRKHAMDASVTDDSCSSRPTSRQPSFGGDKLSNISVDDLSNDSHPAAGQSAGGALAIVRPSPTRLQEEFLRNSQLYAEELMKHQMNFMAATKGLQLNAVGESTRTAGDRKAGFRPHIRASAQPTDKDAAGARWSQPSAKSDLPPVDGIQFRGIHSHLNAISKITSALGRDIVSLTSPIESVTSRESSQSPPSSTSSANFNPHHPHSQHQQPHAQHQHPQNIHQQMINANLMHDSNLKFSIDNILKPGFGRRITDPLLKRNKSSKKSLAQQQRQQLKQQQQQQQQSAEANSNKPPSGVTPIDLTPSATPASGASATASEASSTDKLSEVSERAEPATGTTPAGDPDKGSTSTAATAATATASSSSSSSASPMVWPAWVYCTRYSDRPSSGRSPRTRRPKKPPSEKGSSSDEKRPRTAFSGPQLARLKHEFAENRYLTERRRQQLSGELGLNEAQIKIWFQNKRAKIKKSTGHKNPLALQLMAQGLYNHSTVPLTREEEELQELQAQGKSCT